MRGFSNYDYVGFLRTTGYFEAAYAVLSPEESGKGNQQKRKAFAPAPQLPQTTLREPTEQIKRFYSHRFSAKSLDSEITFQAAVGNHLSIHLATPSNERAGKWVGCIRK